MINQPFVSQTVWFAFKARYDYSGIEREITFYPEPVGVYSSKKDIFKTWDLESKENKEKIKKTLQEIQGKPGNEKSQEIYQKIVNTEHIWKRVLDFENQPKINFEGEFQNTDTPHWLQGKRVTMEIWEVQYYHNKIYDTNEVYCLMEVVL